MTLTCTWTLSGSRNRQVQVRRGLIDPTMIPTECSPLSTMRLWRKHLTIRARIRTDMQHQRSSTAPAGFTWTWRHVAGDSALLYPAVTEAVLKLPISPSSFPPFCHMSFALQDLISCRHSPFLFVLSFLVCPILSLSTASPVHSI